MLSNSGTRERVGYRFFIAPVCLAIWFCILIYRLVDLHLGSRPVRNQTRIKGRFPATRGIIYDREEVPVAVNRPGYKVFVDPAAPVKEGQDKRRTAERIAELTGVDFASVYREITGNGKQSRYIVVGKTFDKEAVDLVTNKAVYCCCGIEPFSERYYPQGRIFSQVVGYVSGEDMVGRNGGVEQAAERYLRGTDGLFEGVKDKNGKEIRERRAITVPAIDGASVYMTIDHNIQHVVRELLSVGITNYWATGGKVIIEKVSTGEILAMVSLPDFDPADFRAYSEESRRNKAIGLVYDPGSTMKAITVSAALNEGLVTPTTVFDVGQGTWAYGGRILRDHPRGLLTVRQIIQKSSNIGAAKIGLMLGNKRLSSYIKAYGFTQKLGIDIPGEEKGLLPPYETWEPVKPTRVAMGQGISVTPLQMVNAYSTIANGGHCMRPYVISRVVAPDGTLVYRNDPKEIGRPIRPDTSEKMRAILKSVTNYAADRIDHGTGWRARVDGYTVAGKTGTAQMLINGAYSEKDYWSSFIGFVPAENPVFAMIVILDRPRGELMEDGVHHKAHDGGGTAAPLFSKIASYVAQYLEIPIEVDGE